MSEPLFFDCLTDTQIWSLFDAGVLHDYRLSVEVYERLERIAPEHGCYLFTWPPGVELPALQELLTRIAVSAGESPTPTHSPGLETPTTTEVIRAAIQAWCARVQTDRAPAGLSHGNDPSSVASTRAIPRTPGARPERHVDAGIGGVFG